jgi:hypothetical protein
MNQANPPVRSFGGLARAALAHPDWPPDVQTQARSLAALFSKFDRNLELEWLGDRPGVRHALSDVLGKPLVSFDRGFGREILATDASKGRIRLDDVPFARVLDLCTEALPAAFPPIVLQPPRWTRVIWDAPSGAGRSLVGRWLQARGLATHVDVITWRDALAHVAQSGPLFVEIHSSREFDLLLGAPPSNPLCVAGALSEWRAAAEAAGFIVVQSPSPATCVEAIVEWLEPRLAADGQFDGDAAAGVLLRWAEAGLAQTLGDLLGVAGLVDEIGVREMGRRSPATHARRHAARRLRAVREEPEQPSWQGDAFELLVNMARRALTDSALPWDAPRDRSTWSRLVPDEMQRTVDPNWLRLVLSRNATSATLKELDRALRDLPPGGYRVVSTLESAGLLRPSGPDRRLSLGPRFLATLVGHEAMRALVHGSAFEWGEALLEPTIAPAVYRELRHRVDADADALIEDVLELGVLDSPAHAAAVEIVVRAVGLAMLCGSIEPPESIVALWDAAVELSIQLDGLARPRVPMPSGPGAPFDLGAYHLAMLAISENLPTREGRRHASLRPWLSSARAFDRKPQLDAIWRSLSDLETRRTLGGTAVALVARLTSSPDQIPEEPHALERPGQLVDGLARGHLDWSAVRPVLADAPAAAGLHAVAEQAGVPWPTVSRAIFEAWSRAEYADSDVIAEAAKECPYLWEHAPEHLVGRAMASGAIAPARVPWAALDDATWLDLARDVVALDVPEPWLVAADRLARLLDEKLPQGNAAEAVWSRYPEAALDALVAHLDRDASSSAAFVEAAPAEQSEAVLAALVRREPNVDRSPFSGFLYRTVARRSPAWRDAYALIAEIERRRDHASVAR